VAYSRPQATNHLLQILLHPNVATVDFFIDCPPSDSSLVTRFRATIQNIEYWRTISNVPGQSFISHERLGGNRNILKAMRWLSETYDGGVLCEDDSDIHQSYLTFLSTNLSWLRQTSRRVAVIPYLGLTKRDLSFSPGKQIQLINSHVIGGTLGMYFSSDTFNCLNRTIESLGIESDLNSISKAIRDLPISFTSKVKFALGVFRKYKSYQDSWSKGIPDPDLHVPSWDGLLSISSLIHRIDVFLTNYSVVREYPSAREEGSWHDGETRSFSWDSVPNELTFNLSQSNQLLCSLVTDLVLRGSKSAHIGDWFRGVCYLFFPKLTARLSRKSR